MATSINAIGGVTFNGYPGPIVPASDTTYPARGAQPTDFADNVANPLDGGNPPNSLSPYDLDGNGVVSPQEYQQARNDTSTALPTTAFAALRAGQDADGDGIPDAGDTNDFLPDSSNPVNTARDALNNGGLDNALQNPVLNGLATQTYGAVSAAAIDQPAQQPPQQQQSLSLLA